MCHDYVDTLYYNRRYENKTICHKILLLFIQRKSFTFIYTVLIYTNALYKFTCSWDYSRLFFLLIFIYTHTGWLLRYKFTQTSLTYKHTQFSSEQCWIYNLQYKLYCFNFYPPFWILVDHLACTLDECCSSISHGDILFWKIESAETNLQVDLISDLIIIANPTKKLVTTFIFQQDQSMLQF